MPSASASIQRSRIAVEPGRVADVDAGHGPALSAAAVLRRSHAGPRRAGALLPCDRILDRPPGASTGSRGPGLERGADLVQRHAVHRRRAADRPRPGAAASGQAAHGQAARARAAGRARCRGCADGVQRRGQHRQTPFATSPAIRPCDRSSSSTTTAATARSRRRRRRAPAWFGNPRRATGAACIGA